VLNVKESKTLVKPLQLPESFDVQIVQSVDGQRAFQVEIDPVQHLVFLSITLNEQTMLITLPAEQAVSVGQWMLEAGYIANFIKKTGLDFSDISEEITENE